MPCYGDCIDRALMCRNASVLCSLWIYWAALLRLRAVVKGFGLTMLDFGGTSLGESS